VIVCSFQGRGMILFDGASKGCELDKCNSIGL